MCGHLFFSPTRLKDVGRLCHLFPLPWLFSLELFWSFYICCSFSYSCLSFRYQISAYTYIRRLSDHSFCYSVIAACYSTFRWDLVSLSAFWWNSMMRIIPSIPPWLCRSSRPGLVSDPVWSGQGPFSSFLFILGFAFPYFPLILFSYREWSARGAERVSGGTIGCMLCPCEGGVLAA